MDTIDISNSILWVLNLVRYIVTINYRLYYKYRVVILSWWCAQKFRDIAKLYEYQERAKYGNTLNLVFISRG